MGLDINRLKEVLDYNPVTGEFTWKVRKNCPYFRKAGMKAGTINDKDYIVIKLFGASYYAHILAIFYVTGIYPKLHIDHKNHITTDNSYENLREKGRSFNMENKTKASYNKKTSSKLGVYKNKNETKYHAKITIKGKSIYLGRANTEEEAYELYLTAKRKYHEGNVL
jgi:hypothetical protein